jgi:hypothetical protein
MRAPQYRHVGAGPDRGRRRKSDMPMTGEFSVCQFFKGGAYEYVRRGVGAQEAVQAARYYTSNVAAKLGIVERVIITDGGDDCCFEWKHGEGVTFPPEAMGRQ